MARFIPFLALVGLMVVEAAFQRVHLRRGEVLGVTGQVPFAQDGRGIAALLEHGGHQRRAHPTQTSRG